MNKILLYILVFIFSISTPLTAKQNQKKAYELLTSKNKSIAFYKSAEVKPFKVTIQMGGSFLNLQYNAGETPSFDFKPPAGIKIESIFNNGIDVTNQLIDYVYTLPPITENILLIITTSIDNSTGVQTPEQQFKIHSSNKKITIKDLQAGQNIELFDLTGNLVHSLKSTGETLIINIEKPGMYIARINKRSYKLVL